MKFKIGLGAGIAVALGAGISAALAQVTLTSTNGTLVCNSHNGVQVSSSGAITINVGSCDLGSGTGGGTGGGDGGTGGEPTVPVLQQNVYALTLQQGGPPGTFTLGLSGPPAQNVTLPLASSSPGIATVTPTSLRFTTSDWKSKTVSVQGVGAGIANITGVVGSYSVNLTATVTGASTGGTGGSDPGLGKKWVTSFEGQKVFVVDRSAYGNRTYFPGCLSQSWSELGLSHNRPLNPFSGSVLTGCRGVHSLRAGETYAQRLPFVTGALPVTIKLGRAEAGEKAAQGYDIALSSTPGNLNPTEFANDRCSMKGTTDGTLSLMARSAWEKMSSRSQRVYCPIEENTVYYFNFRPAAGSAGATKCGTGGYICRVQVIDDIPADYYQDVRVATNSY